MRFVLFILLFFTGCGINDYRLINKSIAQKDPTIFLKQKAKYYSTHPKQFIRDAKYYITHFKKEVEVFKKHILIWPNPKTPSSKTLVKYTDHYKARALIDFEKGYLEVDALKKEYMKKAIVNAILMPDDPRSVDLFSDKIVLKGKPFLAYQVYDFEKKPVLYQWRANRFAEYLIKHSLHKRYLNKRKYYYVVIKLAKNSENTRVKKYLPFVKQYSLKYKIDKSLILGVIKTESDFNPYAVSYVPAFGLMQIVPTTAGVEGYERAYGYKHIPSKNFLFVAKHNINIGSAYLNVLYYRYLSKIKNPISRKYCMISAYNAGIGNVFKVFSIRRDRAVAIINSLSPKEVYYRLRYRLPTNEARNYLPKVLNNQKKFTGI